MYVGRAQLEYAEPGDVVPVNSNWPIDGTLIRRHSDGSVTIRVDTHFIRAQWDPGWEGFENDDSHRDEELNRMMEPDDVTDTRSMPEFLTV
jgi:hypothetical protein